MLRFLYSIIFMLFFVLYPFHDAMAKKYVVGCVLTADISHYHKMYSAFVSALAKKGIDRKNAEIYLQSPNPDPVSWANSVRKLKGLDVDIIVAFGAPAAFSAFKEVKEIPLLYLDVYGPVELGMARSLTSSGNNSTGISSKLPVMTVIKLLNSIIPIHNLGIIYSSREAGSAVQASEVRRSAAQFGFSVREQNILTSADIENNLHRLLKGVDTLFVTENISSQKNMDKIVRKAAEYRVPVVSLVHDAAHKGALMSLEAESAEEAEQAAEMAYQILNGSNPSRMKIATNRKIDLIINLKAAKQLDLTVPYQVLSNATKVIK